VLVSACGGGATAGASPTPSAPPATFTPYVPPTPEPSQRVERSLPVPIEETAAAAAGGNLYVMGGFNAAGASLDGTYVFDGTTWRTGPRLPLPLDHPSAAALDGRVYIAGGHSNGRDSPRLFRLDGDHWTELAPMHYARGGHALVASEGRLYAIGGNTARGNVGPVEVYDPSSNAWSVITSLPDPRNHVMGFVVAGAVCVAGGRAPTTSRVDCYDAGRNAWAGIPNLPQPSSGGGGATFTGGDVVVAGGQDASETRIVPQLVRYSFGGAWTGSESMLDPRHGFELAIYEGRAWACGGGSAPGLHPVTTCTSIGDSTAGQRGR
jgi:non-specific serine/threonine protein kinase